MYVGDNQESLHAQDTTQHLPMGIDTDRLDTLFLHERTKDMNVKTHIPLHSTLMKALLSVAQRHHIDQIYVGTALHHHHDLSLYLRIVLKTQ